MKSINVLGWTKKLLKSFVFAVPRLTLIYKIIRDNRMKIGVPKEIPLGFKFIDNSKTGMDQGTFEVNELEIVKKCLNYVDTFINIGANIGYYCCVALQQNKRTIAFEPIDTNLIYLYTNIKANNWENNIDVFPIALGNKTEIAEIYGVGTGASLIKGWAGASEHDRRLIPVSTLDKMLANRLEGKKCFFLVDIEGFEKSMLEGAIKHLVMTPKPIWMVEIVFKEHQPKGTSRNPNFEETFDIFWEKGYEAYAVGNQLSLINREDIKKICKTGRNSLSTFNFLFIDKCDMDNIFLNGL